jgi:hypothetical protein
MLTENCRTYLCHVNPTQLHPTPLSIKYEYIYYCIIAAFHSLSFPTFLHFNESLTLSSFVQVIEGNFRKS